MDPINNPLHPWLNLRTMSHPPDKKRCVIASAIHGCPTEPPHGRTARRRFLKWAVYGGLGLLLPGLSQNPAAADLSCTAPLTLHHARTGETLRIGHAGPGGYSKTVLADVSRLMRDTRTGAVKAIDPGLLDYLSKVQAILNVPDPFYITSGYRSRGTNDRLRRTGKGAAPNSYHLKGQAVDLWIPGIAIATLRQAALKARGGGVGYYPERHFVHLDVGPYRHWTT